MKKPKITAQQIRNMSTDEFVNFQKELFIAGNKQIYQFPNKSTPNGNDLILISSTDDGNLTGNISFSQTLTNYINPNAQITEPQVTDLTTDLATLQTNIDAVQTNLTDHVDDTSNPHQTTLQQGYDQNQVLVLDTGDLVINDTNDIQQTRIATKGTQAHLPIYHLGDGEAINLSSADVDTIYCNDQSATTNAVNIQLEGAQLYANNSTFCAWANGSQALSVVSVAGVTINGVDNATITIATGAAVQFNRLAQNIWESNTISLAAGLGIEIDDTGLISTSGSGTPVLSAFSAALSGALLNATGDGTLVNVTCGDVYFNIGGDYNNSTGLYTAPIDAVYEFGVSIFLGNLSALHTQYLFYLEVDGATTYMMSQGNPANEKSAASNQLTRRGNLVVNLTAGQTVRVLVEVDGTSKTASIGAGTQPTEFFGFLVGTDSGVAGVTSLNGQTGSVSLISTDGSILISASGGNVALASATGITNQLYINSATVINMALQTRYIVTYAGGQSNGILPTATGSGKTVEIAGLATASSSGWIVNAQGTDKIQVGSSGSSLGGSVASTVGSSTDCMAFIDAGANIWITYPSSGKLFVVS